MDPDIEAILAHRHDNGADFWTTPDGRIYVGNPFSTLGALGMLHELGVEADEEATAGALRLVVARCREDGRIRVAPKAPMYPCYTAEAARMLCRFGLFDGDEIRRTVAYLRDHEHEGGGWRCSFSRFGKGPETLHANPGATLYALDVLRFDDAYRSGDPVADRAVAFLLSHWETRVPLGPCHWGIGTTFLQVEYPFLRYNLFFYCYVLSFFDRALDDARFAEALGVLSAALDDDGQMVVERPHRNLGRLAMCRRGEPSVLATRRYREILANVDR